MPTVLQSSLVTLAFASLLLTACDKKEEAPLKAPAAAAKKAPVAVAEKAAASAPTGKAEVATAPSADQGKAIYGKVCIACHSIDGSKLVGPTMKGMYGRQAKGTKGESYVLDDAGITTSIKEPSKNIAEGYPPAMVLPAPLSDGEIKSVITYLKTLK